MLCSCTSCTQIFGSTRLTQISVTVFMGFSGVCVEIIMFCGSGINVCVVAAIVVTCVWVVVVFLLQPAVIRSVLFSDVFAKGIFGKFDFLPVSIFLVDSISLASRTGVSV